MADKAALDGTEEWQVRHEQTITTESVMSSRRDYIAIAKIFSDLRSVALSCDGKTVWDLLSWGIADHFRRENTTFVYTKFFKACDENGMMEQPRTDREE